MALVQRQIDITFQLGKGAFGEDGISDTVTLQGHRVQTAITGIIGPGMGVANVRLFGLKPTLWQQLASLNQAAEALRRNRLVISAGDAGEALATVFNGQITLSQYDANAQPDTALNVTAHAGLLEAVKPAQARSYPGVTRADVVLYNLAQEMGLAFENGGVDAVFAKLYLPPSSPREQVERVVQAAKAEFVIDGQTLAVWPKGGSRGGLIPVISPDTGMVGYPNYSTSTSGGWLSVTTLFNPNIRIGGVVEVQSSLKVANGKWVTHDIRHELDAEMPGGHWFTKFEATIMTGA